MCYCPLCNEIVRSRDNLKGHIHIDHHNIQMKTFDRDGCRTAFLSWQDLLIHKASFYELTTYICYKYTMTFTTKFDLYHQYCMYILCLYELAQY